MNGLLENIMADIDISLESKKIKPYKAFKGSYKETKMVGFSGNRDDSYEFLIWKSYQNLYALYVRK